MVRVLITSKTFAGNVFQSKQTRHQQRLCVHLAKWHLFSGKILGFFKKIFLLSSLSLDQVLEKISMELRKEPSSIRSMNLLRKGHSDSLSKVELNDRVYDTWQALRNVLRFLSKIKCIFQWSEKSRNSMKSRLYQIPIRGENFQ